MKKIKKTDNNKKGYIFATKGVVCSMLAFSTFAVMANSCSEEEIREYLSENSIPTNISEYTSTSETVESTTSTTEIIETTNYNDYIASEIDLNGVETGEYELAYSFAEHSMQDCVMTCDSYDYCTIYHSALGYDNLFLKNNLINYANEISGVYDANIGIDNYRYFLYYRNIHYQAESSDSIYGDYMLTEYNVPQLRTARAVLAENNLRFFVDEIPSSYFYERFPEFMRIVDQGNIVWLFDEIVNNNVHNINSIDAIDEPYVRDLYEFWSCARYNTLRMNLIYGYDVPNEDYSDDVRQVRDLRNNRHVLIPTEEQYNEIMENLHEVPTFENIDIYQVETREEYFDAYGVYPEDVLSEERYDLNYEPYVSPYEFDVVQIDQNMNSNQGRSRTPN